MSTHSAKRVVARGTVVGPPLVLGLGTDGQKFFLLGGVKDYDVGMLGAGWSGMTVATIVLFDGPCVRGGPA